MLPADRVRATIVEHLEAFNAHDSARLLAGLSPDAVWTTGVDTVRGTAELTEVFDPDLDADLDTEQASTS